MRVDPVTQERRLVASFTIGAGEPLTSPRDVAIEPDGQLVVVGGGRASVMRVHPRSGDRTTLSESPTYALPRGVIVAQDGALVKADSYLQAVARVDPDTGERGIVSGCTNVDNQERCVGELIGAGPPFVSPYGLVEVGRRLLVVDIARDAVIEVDPITHHRTIFSGCTTVPEGICASELIGAGPPFRRPSDIVAQSSGQLIVVDTFPGAVFKVDVMTGDRSIVSGGISRKGVGPRFSRWPIAVEVELDGNLVVVDEFFDRVVRVNPDTGERSVVSGCAEFDELDQCIDGVFIGTGPSFANPVGVAVEADRSLIVIDLALEAVFRVNPRNGDRRIISKCRQTFSDDCQ